MSVEWLDKPTGPGPYYWKGDWPWMESPDANRVRCVDVERGKVFDLHVRGHPVDALKGQWLPIPEPDELIALGRNARAVHDFLDCEEEGATIVHRYDKLDDPGMTYLVVPTDSWQELFDALAALDAVRTK